MSSENSLAPSTRHFRILHQSLGLRPDAPVQRFMSRSGDAKLCNGGTSSGDVHARLLRRSHGPVFAISRGHGQHAPGLGWFRLHHCRHDDCRQQQSTGFTAGLQREQQRLPHPVDRGCPEASEHRQGGRLAALRPHLRRRTAGSLQDSRLATALAPEQP